MHRGYIRLYRKGLEHPLFAKPLVWHFWNYCLLRANYKDREIIFKNRPFMVKRGSFMMSLKNAAKDTGLTIQNIRTSMKILENFKMIKKSTQEVTRQATIITICKYDDYQKKNKEVNADSNTVPTQSQHSPNTVLTIDNKVNKVKKDKNVKKGERGAASNPKIQNLFQIMKEKLAMADQEINAVYVGCSNPEKLAEAVQCALEFDQDLRAGQGKAISDPAAYIRKAYAAGKQSGKTRLKSGNNKPVPQKKERSVQEIADAMRPDGKYGIKLEYKDKKC